MSGTQRSLLSCLAAVAMACSGSDGGGGGGTNPPPAPSRTVAQAAPSGDGQTGQVQTALANPMRIVVMSDGQPEAGVTVTWQSSGTAGSLNPASGTTGSDGTASATWTLPREAGNHSATATVANATGSPVSFGATATAGPASGLAFVGGNNQVGGINSDAANPLQVRVTDQFGNGIAGHTVNWTVQLGDATVPASSTTDASGVASATLSFGATPSGPVQVTASAAGIGGTVIFNATVGVLVTVSNNVFTPSAITVNSGDYVVWNWAPTAVSHTVDPDDAANPAAGMPPSTGAPTNAPFNAVFQFNQAGVFQYFCTVHGGPSGVGMAGTVTVQ